MKALSVKNPWAALIARGAKSLEIRSWRTHFRGEFVLCSSATPDKRAYEFDVLQPHGVVLAVCELVNVREATQSDTRDARCLVSPGDFAWEVRVLKKLPERSVKGRLGFWEIEL